MAGDVGLDQIEVFYRGAAAGTFRMEAGVAEACAADVQTLIDALKDQQRAGRVDVFGAFGGFESAKQMQAGFEAKLQHLGGFLDEYIAAAELLRQSFLVASGSIEAVELGNVATLIGMADPYASVNGVSGL